MAPHFGLTPKKYQSGVTDHGGRISKISDGSVRTALHESANVIGTRPVKGAELKCRALAVARRAGPRKARGALARKLFGRRLVVEALSRLVVEPASKLNELALRHSCKVGTAWHAYSKTSTDPNLCARRCLTVAFDVE
ncbi:transposase [Ensifer sp. ENS09]|uniref:transposase n=1 Tax=Ensifer sp. ENS09 TaxID=2769263 RepID=UPI00352E8388